MDGDRDLQPSSAGLAIKILQVLGVLHDTGCGGAVYHEVERLLDELQRAHLRAERAYATVADALLQGYLGQLDPGTPLHTELRILQEHLRPPVIGGEQELLRERIEQYAERIVEAHSLDADRLGQVVAPLLSGAVGDPDPAPAQAESLWCGQDIPSDPFSSMEERRGKLRELHDSLGGEIRESIAQNEEFGVMLDLVMGELQHLRSMTDTDAIRQHLLDQVKRLHHGQFALAEKLASTERYLSLMQSDSQYLDDELAQARMLSMTDELTELPNRRAFMGRLEDEVARVRRYGMALSLAIIDLDGFKSINDEHGHAAGDEVLRCYASHMFTVFRHHDMVARYGGEEFAVLLPNTDRDGAVQALTKIQSRIAELQYEGDGYSVRLPSFSAGVASYRDGEPPSALIERADRALYRAKRLGRSRVEVDGAAQPAADDDPDSGMWPAGESQSHSSL